MRISICIPTYKRPLLLKECLDSVLKQQLDDFEILIGDDSPDDQTEKIVQSYFRNHPQMSVHYFHNIPSLGQAENIHMLFEKSAGDVVSLIHDDDMYCDGALRLLSSYFNDPTIAVAFGKQMIADESGVPDTLRSEKLNRGFYRMTANAGVQEDFLQSALVQQFPNDGFLMRAEVTKLVGYVDAGRLMGDACDFGFGILCALAFPNLKCMFVDSFTAIYREGKESVGRRNAKNDAAYRAFKYVSGLHRDITEKPIMTKWLREKAPVAIAQAIALGHRKEALGIYFSKWHLPRIVTPGGIKRALLLVWP